MYKIGDFSKMSKVTIKGLRYYESEGLLLPSYIDEESGYRYYESSQLSEVAQILSLKQIGLTISQIKKIILDGQSLEEVLEEKKRELYSSIQLYQNQLQKINSILEEKKIMNEIIVKEIPSYSVYYKEGVIPSYADLAEFVLAAGAEVQKLNPTLTCVEPGYCYVSYLDKGYQEKNIRVRYVEAVTQEGIGNESIHFARLTPIKVVCMYHKGAYAKLGESYAKVLKYIENNQLSISGEIRESYIDGCWNKESEEEYLTEIQVPIL